MSLFKRCMNEALNSYEKSKRDTAEQSEKVKSESLLIKQKHKDTQLRIATARKEITLCK